MIISKGVGIDLGTTNSAVAVLDASDSEALLYRDRSGRVTVPSCVWHDPKKNAVVVGHEAFVRRGSRPEPITSVKRRMGTRAEVMLGDAPALPEDVSAHILADLRERIRGTLDDAEPGSHLVDRAIITVPAYFDLPQIEATRTAGRLAGLAVLELLHEPVAAAVYYSWKFGIPDGVFLVYDLGGGTLDVSVLRRTAGEFEVLGISGDNFLGGDDFDRLLAEWIRQRLVEEGYDLDLDVEHDAEDTLRFAGLVLLAEQAKKRLSTRQEYLLCDQNTLSDKSGQRVLVELLITREVFESLIRSHVERTVSICWEALAKAYRKADITLADVDHICLVGGSTHVPLVRQTIIDTFCAGDHPAPSSEESAIPVLDRVDAELREIVGGLISRAERARCTAPIADEPEVCVALGAAVRAASADLHVYDADRRIRIRFRNSSGTARTQSTIRGNVDAVDESISLAGAMVGLAAQDGNYVDEQCLDDGRFRFDDVPLGDGGLNTLTITVRDPAGGVLAEMGRTIRQGAGCRDIGGVLSTAVLSKPIVLEGVEQGRLTRAVLLREGTSLPASAQFRFELRDSTGRVRFPLYQAHRVIKDIEVCVATDLPPGTPITFTISCDAQARLRIQGRIGASSFDVPVGAPPPPTTPTEEDLLDWRQRFTDRTRRLSAEHSDPLTACFEALVVDVQEAIRAGDDAKAISKGADIEGLIKSVDLYADGMDPPWSDVEDLIAQIDDLIDLAEGTACDFDAAAARGTTMATLVDEARQAMSARDQVRYSESVEALQLFRDSVRQRLESRSRDQQDLPPHVQAAAQLQDLCRKTQLLGLLCLVQGRADLIRRLQSIESEAAVRQTQVDESPHDVSMWCFSMQTELAKIAGGLGPVAEADDTIKDLVSFDRASRTPIVPGASGEDPFGTFRPDAGEYR